MKKFFVCLILFCIFIIESIQTQTRPHLAFLLSNSPYVDTLLNLFAHHLKPGDYLLITGTPSQSSWVVQKSQEAKNKVVAGVNVFSTIVFVNIDTLEVIVPTLSDQIDWIVYDYELGPNFSPEFTTNQQTSIMYFDRGLTISHQYGFKFMVTPPYAQLRNANWNWGEVARHMDGIDVQFQAFIKAPQILVPEAINVARQIDSLSSNILTMIQLSLIQTRGTVDENLFAIMQLRNEPVDAFLMFYHPTQSDTLRVFFDKLDSLISGISSETYSYQFALLQNYPNPFNFNTIIPFHLYLRNYITLKVFDVLGNEIATLINGEMPAGEHSIIYNIKNLSSGVYLYRLQAGQFIDQKKMVVVK